MRHLPENLSPSDRMILPLMAEVELVEQRSAKEGKTLSVRVICLKSGATAKPKQVDWALDEVGILNLDVTVGSKQRLQVIGLSNRRREMLREHLAGLSPTEAHQLLSELTNNSSQPSSPPSPKD